MKDATKCSFSLKSLEVTIPQVEKTYRFGNAEDEPTVNKTPAAPIIIKVQDLEIKNDFDVLLDGEEYGQAMKFGENVINATNQLMLGIMAAVNQQQQARREERKSDRLHNKELRQMEMNHEKEIKKLDDQLDAAKHQRIQAAREKFGQ